MTGNEILYRARWVFPIDGPPIQNGLIRVVGGTIAEVGQAGRQGIRSDHPHRIDLGDLAVMPKLVNAHTHLEFSDCREVIGDAGIPLASWIGEVIAARGQVDGPQRDANVQRGLAESERCGVGLIGDIATTPTNYPDSIDARIVSFAEVLGLSEHRGRERFESAQRHRETLQSHDQLEFGVSPHAPYSTPLPLMEASIELANRDGSPVAMHLAESPDERVLLESGEGPFADALKTAGLWQDGLFPHDEKHPIGSLIERLGTARRSLLVHGNDLRDDEINRVAKNKGMSVVYCPRTHDFFGYGPHPADRLVAGGVRVALGTDSRASNPDLNLWGEVQHLLRHRQDLSPEMVLNMATVAGAEALLGVGTCFGRIVAGVSGGLEALVAVKTSANTLDQVYRDFADHECQCIKLSDQA